MLKEIRKGMMAGIGAVLLTRDKVDEVTQKLVREAKLSEEDARRLAEDLVESGEQQFNKIESSISEGVRSTLENLGVGRQDTLQRLKDKVDALEIRVSILEKGREIGKDPEKE